FPAASQPGLSTAPSEMKGYGFGAPAAPRRRSVVSRPPLVPGDATIIVEPGSMLNGVRALPRQGLVPFSRFPGAPLDGIAAAGSFRLIRTGPTRRHARCGGPNSGTLALHGNPFSPRS